MSAVLQITELDEDTFGVSVKLAHCNRRFAGRYALGLPLEIAEQEQTERGMAWCAANCEEKPYG